MLTIHLYLFLSMNPIVVFLELKISIQSQYLDIVELHNLVLSMLQHS